MSQIKRQEDTLRGRNRERDYLTQTAIAASSSAQSGAQSQKLGSEDTKTTLRLEQDFLQPTPTPQDTTSNTSGTAAPIGNSDSTRSHNAVVSLRGLANDGNNARNLARNEDSGRELMKSASLDLTTIHSQQQGTAALTPTSLPLNVFSVKSGTRQQRVEMPRTSSIDSAISSISTTSHPQKSNLEAKDPSLEEIRSLMDTAGSPETLIQQLLKEKNNAASQNTQLWKLVDKQRALLLGLNKDLERITKEKDRYRKKLKEMQGQVPQLPPHMVRKDSQSPVRNGTPASPTIGDRHDSGSNTPDIKPQSHFESSTIDAAMMPSPLHLQQQSQAAKPQSQLNRQDSDSSLEDAHSSLDMAKIAESPPPRIIEPQGPPQSLQAEPNLFPPRHLATEPTRQLPKLHQVQTSLGPPSLNLIEPSPLAEKPNKSFSAARKAPAPLNLKQSNGPIAIVQDIKPGEHRGSAIEEGDEPDDSPKAGRGRRKTREEDDRDRELAVLQEQEARSRSKKEKILKAKLEDANSEIKETWLLPPTLPSLGLPASPRHPPPAIQDRLLPPSVNISNAQSEPQESGAITERLLTAPLRSPGLPVSPRPGGRPMGSPLPRNPKDNSSLFATLPMSPRGGMPLSPRAPLKPIPLPPGAQLVATSFDTRAVSNPQSQQETKISQSIDIRTMSPTEAPQIYRGLVSSAYPDLLLPPNALPSIDVKVASSRLRPFNTSVNTSARTQDESAVFTLSIFSRSNSQELWRIEKSTFALPQLDYALRPLCNTLPKAPERKLFIGHAPAVMDARRSSINAYFDELLDTPMDEISGRVICQFLSTDTIDSENSMGTNLGQPSSVAGGRILKPKKAGYLTKRGKNFGGWKSRYYVLEGPELRSFEAPGGQHLSTIKLLNAQIGKQSQGDSPTSQGDDGDENQYRHAFLVLEPKKKDSSSLMKHVLCAESDAERDEWVVALLHYVDGLPSTGSDATSIAEEGAGGAELDDGGLKAIKYADTIPGASPTSVALSQKMAGDPTSPQSGPSPTFAASSNPDQVTSKSIISGPINGAVISDAGLWGNKPAAQAKEHKKRNMFHFRQKPSSDSVTSQVIANEGHNPRLIEHYNGPPVFGLPLAEAVEYCSPIGVNVNLPAVVYRCIEYLRVKNAASEEGIFRLSGSNLVIRTLKERFNTEGDVDFLADGQYYDVHAIASLFKTYLRELPATILTRDLHLDFLHVLELEDSASKITALNILVHRLPHVNFSLLRTLSQYLLEVVQNSDENKMNVRNVGIVFSPTMNIPAPVFALFLMEFDEIFGDLPSHDGNVRKIELTVPKSLSPDDIRSPRHQMFTDLPTPGYDQTAFQNDVSDNTFPSTPSGKQHVATNSTEDVGFTPLQQTYEIRRNVPIQQQQPLTSHQPWQPFPQQPSADAAYGSLNRMMAPDDGRNARAKRRESSMLMM